MGGVSIGEIIVIRALVIMFFYHRKINQCKPEREKGKCKLTKGKHLDRGLS